MDFLAKNPRTNSLLYVGIAHGGQQYLDYQKPEAPGVAMGSVRFMIEGD
jgi:hypothetical protein